MAQFPTIRQIIRYGIVGLLTNFCGYLIYLLVTFLWLDPKVAITVLYPVGIALSYFGHSKYSFSYEGKKTMALFRFLFSHLIGYGVNFLMLFIFSDKFDFPHQAVQAVSIFVVAGVLFLLFKYFVFPHSEKNELVKI